MVYIHKQKKLAAASSFLKCFFNCAQASIQNSWQHFDPLIDGSLSSLQKFALSHIFTCTSANHIKYPFNQGRAVRGGSASLATTLTIRPCLQSIRHNNYIHIALFVTTNNNLHNITLLSLHNNLDTYL